MGARFTAGLLASPAERLGAGGECVTHPPPGGRSQSVAAIALFRRRPSSLLSRSRRRSTATVDDAEMDRADGIRNFDRGGYGEARGGDGDGVDSGIDGGGGGGGGGGDGAPPLFSRVTCGAAVKDFVGVIHACRVGRASHPVPEARRRGTVTRGRPEPTPALPSPAVAVRDVSRDGARPLPGACLAAASPSPHHSARPPAPPTDASPRRRVNRRSSSHAASPPDAFASPCRVDRRASRPTPPHPASCGLCRARWRPCRAAPPHVPPPELLRRAEEAAARSGGADNRVDLRSDGELQKVREGDAVPRPCVDLSR